MPNQTPDGDQFDEFAPREQGFSLLRTPRAILTWYLRAGPLDLLRHWPRRTTSRRHSEVANVARAHSTTTHTRRHGGRASTILRKLLYAGLGLLGLLGVVLAVLTVGAELSSLTSGHGVVQLRLSGYVEPFWHSHAPGVGWHHHVGSYWWYWTCVVVTLLVTISATARIATSQRVRRQRRRRRRASDSFARDALVITRDMEIAQARARFDDSMATPPKPKP